MRWSEFLQFWVWAIRICHILAQVLGTNKWRETIRTVIIDWNDLTIEGPHCIAYMSNYITPTDPLSQSTCRTVGVHTKRGWPINVYRPIVNSMTDTMAFFKPLSDKLWNTAEGNTMEQNKRSWDTWELYKVSVSPLVWPHGPSCTTQLY